MPFPAGRYFYPRPPRGGRRADPRNGGKGMGFLSTPSVRRATCTARRCISCPGISIHALREEGDTDLSKVPTTQEDFYPRPPRGGRLFLGQCTILFHQFLSTPSARRATGRRRPRQRRIINFYPRPPRGGRLAGDGDTGQEHNISIHALREEGDCFKFICFSIHYNFYPRPPRGGRPRGDTFRFMRRVISIHALREEGDLSRLRR